MAKLIISQNDQEFIKKHVKDKVSLLALSKHKYIVENWEYVLQQISARQKAEKRLPQWYQNYELIFPEGISMEQCSSEITAQYKASLCKGETLIDLTTGFGVDLLTMASQFENIYGCEPNEKLCQILKHNAHIFQLSKIKIFNTSAESFLKSEDCPNAEWIYIDPSRRNTQGERVELLQYSPNIFAIKQLLFQKAPKILIKLAPMLDIKLLIREFPETECVHIIAVENECKEILLEINSTNKTKTNRKIITINFTKKGKETFSFLEQEEEIAPLQTTNPKPNDYLYEPNAAIMKSGGFKCIATRFDVKKIEKNSHLYISNKPCPEFPGRQFQIIQVIENFRKENLKRILPQKAYNLTIRNFPETAETLKKRLKIHDGGDNFLFATTNKNGSYILLLCKKISHL